MELCLTDPKLETTWCPSTGEWTRTIVTQPYNGSKYYLAAKGNRLFIDVTTWMNFKIIWYRKKLDKMSAYCMIPLICSIDRKF